MQANEQIRLGLVGTGAWVLKYLAAVDEAAGAVLTHVASPNARQKEIPVSIDVHENWRDLLTLDLDGLIVATPPDTHAGITRAALEAGQAVLVEKPVTSNANDARALLDLARSKKAILHVGHIDLQSPALVAVLDQLPRHEDIKRVAGGWSNAGPWRDDAEPLWDWGPHPLACALRVTGFEIDQLIATAKEVGQGWLYHVQGNFGGVDVDLTFGNGSPARQRWMEITTADHVFRYDDDADDKAKCDGKPLDYAKTPALTAQVERFADSIRQGGQDTADAELALEVIKLLEQIEKLTA